VNLSVEQIVQKNLPFTAETDEAGPRAELRGPAATVAFMLAGNAHVTFQSRRTDTRFTYRIRAVKPRVEATFASEGRASHFVYVLVGPDNDSSYQYLGCIYRRTNYAHGRKSLIATNAQSETAFAWVWRYLVSGRMHPDLATYHEGRCGKCGRRLTDPTSIETGLGPKCRGER